MLLYFSFNVFDFTISTKRLFECNGYDPKPQRDIQRTRATCQADVIRALMNTKIDEITLVREHIFKMFDHLNILEILGGEIDAESQIDIIPESLPCSFN